MDWAPGLTVPSATAFCSIVSICFWVMTALLLNLPPSMCDCSAMPVPTPYWCQTLAVSLFWT